ncbi:MAG TPA: phosphatase PAP2 family protein [Ignavibacteriaceae bacterium]|nr:phosphatase PAP2 family protein [Ignavibacteriaceae bacterium]
MKSNFKNLLARIISILFVPPSFTIIVFTYFAFLFENKEDKRFILILITLTFGFLFHIVVFFYLRSKGKLTDSEASIKEERTFPYIISTIIYLAGFVILLFFQINIISTALWFCYISNTVLIMLINKYWKISAHTMGASGPLASLFFAIGWQAILFFPLRLIIGWARIHRKMHTLSQVVAGALIGFSSTFLQMYIIINLL